MSTPPESPVVDVIIHLALAIDLGYEVDLERARSLLPGESEGLAYRRRTPESIRYRPAPLRVRLDGVDLSLPGAFSHFRAGQATLSLFDFGAASLLVPFAVRLSTEELTRLASELAEPGRFVQAARRVVDPWIERVKPAIVEFEPSPYSEEFFLFQFDESMSGWLLDRPEYVAGLVRLEPGRLSGDEVVEATRLRLSYAPNDLVVLDWAAGVVSDRDCNDTLQVIEFANLQLLEFRTIDDRLDDRLEAAYRLIHPERRPRRFVPWWRTHAEAIRSIRELEIEATSLFERTENALKLIGDQYLSRVYGLASQRFHLDEWQQSIQRKVDAIGSVFDLLVEQGHSRRAELLELTVVLLIMLEIVLAFVRH